MRRLLIAALATVMASGCTTVAVKNFKVFADPPDAQIKVVSGADLKEMQFRSPAHVTVEMPDDPAVAAKTFVEVQKADYKTFTAPLSGISDGQTLNVKLEKIVKRTARYKLSYRMIVPVDSADLQYRDRTCAFSFTIEDQSFQMRFENLSSYDVKILWDQAEYTDVNRQARRIMHSGIRYPDRNNPIPDQIVLAGTSVQEGVIPVNSVTFSQQKRAYELQTLFPIDSDAAADLKGKAFNLFLPVEINRSIIPYNFRFEIVDAVKEQPKE